MADNHSGEEEQQSEVKISSPLVWGVVWALVVPVILLVLIATIVYTDYVRAPSKEAPGIVAERIKPIGEVAVRDPNAPVVLKSGEEVFKGLCINCHGAGLMGAPKAGDKSMWSKVIAQGENTLFDHALKGIRAMPAKGGNPDLDDLEVKRAVVYMANLAGANWKVPQEPLPSSKADALPAAKNDTEVVTPPSPAVQSSGVVSTPTSLSPTVAAVSSSPSKVDGKTVFDGTCTACHSTGAAGAPKAGDKAAWAPRIAKGKAVLVQHALQGVGVMPPKGGNSALTNDEVKAAVDYLVGLAQ